MQSIILAAGMGKRLKELTQNNTKCMIKVNGITLIERMLKQLDELNLNQIVIVIGYEGKKLVDYINTLQIKTPIIYIENQIYNKTNNIYSLFLAKEYLLKDDTILLESDIIFQNGLLKSLIDDSRDTLALVDKYESWMDGTCLKLNDVDSIISFISKNDFDYSQKDEYYKTVNIYKFSKYFSNKYYVPLLNSYLKEHGDNAYYEQVIKSILMIDKSVIKAKRLNRELWYEIDDIQDLDIAESLFEMDEEKRLSRIQSRYGGYWRYPKLIDFCYLVNPFYPPKRLIEEMISNFNTLLTQYPSGMSVNSLLAAKIFNVHQDHIVVGNGAAEIIKSLLEMTKGKIGFIKPTFEEYPNRYNSEESVVYYPTNDDFKYNEKEIIDFFSNNKIDNLILINPDNPSGNYISKEGILKIVEWTKTQNIQFILDESFVDFSSENEPSMISEDLINMYPNLVIIKSISKSYGIPGIRLGILVSSNVSLINKIKKDVSIWNINSFGEFWLQIAEKYTKDYKESLTQFRNVRKKFIDDLNKINDVRVIPSQANFVMVEILNKFTSKELTKNLLSKYNILVKDLSSKINNNKQYIRIAIKDEKDNNIMIKALMNEINIEKEKK